jgi:hypothetical protein
MLTVTYLIDRIPIISFENKSPLEFFSKKKSNIDHLRVFGFVFFVDEQRKDKFDIIYSTQKGYKS